jgi:hypothetical protein
VDVQITKWLHLSFFIFKSAGEREGWFEGDLINSLQTNKNTKNTDSHPAVLLNSLKFCAPVVFVWLWLFFSCLRRRGRRIREDQILQCFPQTYLSIFANILFISFTFNIKFMFCICFIIIIDLIFIDFWFIHFCLEICQWHLNVRFRV